MTLEQHWTPSSLPEMKVNCKKWIMNANKVILEDLVVCVILRNSCIPWVYTLREIHVYPARCIPWVAAPAVRWSGWSRKFAADSVQHVLWFAARIAVCNTWSSGGTALCRVGGATSQLDLPCLTPLSVAGYGWLQLGAPHWATSVITGSSW